MKKTITALCFAVLAATLLPACKKNNDKPAATSADMVTPQGTLLGTAVSKLMDAGGGTLTSADGKFKISVPVGALTAPINISIQPITNENKAGVGTAYRILPHSLQFNKPVTLTFTYSDAEIVGSAPDLLGISYQTDNGEWMSIGNVQVDKTNKKLTGTTMHFSDWTVFESCYISPASTTADLNESVELKALTVMLISVEGEKIYKLKEPRELDPIFIKNWQCSAGVISSGGTGHASYKAPSSVPSGNPVAINAVLDFKQPGWQVQMLVSSVTIKGNTGIDYFEVDETNRKLYLYDTRFGNDPGEGKRSVKIGGIEAQVETWLPGLIICKITATTAGNIVIASQGKPDITDVLRIWQGSFLYTRYQGGVINSASDNALKEQTVFDLIYRGCGKVRPANIPDFHIEHHLNEKSLASYTLSGQATVTQPDACLTTTSVSIPSTSGSTYADSYLQLFITSVEETPGGIDVKLRFSVLDVVKNIKLKYTSNCTQNPSYSEGKTFGVGIEGFNNIPIKMAFSGDKLKLVSNGAIVNEIKSAALTSSSILVNAWDNTGSPSHYTTDGTIRTTITSL